jgi:2-dehydro-3-deoxyphosphogluconate aldolase / (4S)-4-hydroxy-2-oxoglutarate aldolase
MQNTEVKVSPALDRGRIQNKIAAGGIIPVVRAANVDEAFRAVEAIFAGGISVMEVTMTVPGAINVIRKVVQEYGDKILTGAGTVLTAQQAEECMDAGSQFLVSPGLSSAVLSAAKARGILAIPGVLTPTEVMSALQEGTTLMKVFPCGSVGGAKYLKALRGPFPQISMIPTGGVNAANAGEYIQAGALALGIGGELVDIGAIRSGNSQKVTAAARELVLAVETARQQMSSANNPR